MPQNIKGGGNHQMLGKCLKKLGGGDCQMLGKCPKMEERFIAVRLMGHRDGGAGSWSPFKKKKGFF